MSQPRSLDDIMREAMEEYERQHPEPGVYYKRPNRRNWSRMKLGDCWVIPLKDDRDIWFQKARLEETIRHATPHYTGRKYQVNEYTNSYLKVVRVA